MQMLSILKRKSYISTITRCLSVALVLTVIAQPYVNGQERTNIVIVFPEDGGKVNTVQTVAGTVREVRSDEHVYVFIKSFSWGGWWVQPLPAVSGGKWTATAYFGRPQDHGEKFAVVALIMRSLALEPGTVLDSLPDSVAMSNIVTVLRQ
jgi:hypothetical protein